ncbi:MAG: hypothetical protein K6E97_11595 [Treponema sp.]|nr:hypothetical protein [Treponema sp.]
MNIIKKIIPVLFIIFSFVVIKFRSVPTGHIWNDYTVLYVEDSCDDAEISSVFDSLEISDYVSADNQLLPIEISKNSPEEAMLRLNINSSENEYLKKRMNYFYDASKKYRLYYVPDRFNDKLNQCISILEQKDIYAGVDSSLSFPFILPVLGIAAFVILLLCSKNRIVFAVSSIPFVLYIFCNPFYSCAAASFLLMLVVFFISNLWRREGFVKVLLTDYKNYVLILLALIAAFSNSGLSGLLFMLSIASSFAALFYFNIRESIIESRQVYKYLMIRTADKISPYAGKGPVVLVSLMLCIFSIFAYFLIFSSDNIRGHFAKILLPGSSVVKSDAFPELTDYTRWTFDVITKPLVSVNKNTDKNKVVYPRFVREDNLIKQVDYTLIYDDTYKNTVLDSINNLGFESIEKVVKIQGHDFKCGYTSASNFHVSVFSVICIILCFSSLLFLFISINKKGGKK